MTSESDSDSEDELLFSATQIRPSGPPRRLHLLTFLSAIGGFLFGYDTGVVSGAMVLIRKEWGLSDFWQETIVSATILSACLTALLGGVLVDRLGRRPTILLASFMFLLGSIVMAAAPGRVVLLMGRLVVGAGVGLASNTIPLYISECSTVEMRGVLVTMNNVAITGGQLVAGLVCGGLSTTSGGWRYMLGAAALPACVQLLGFAIMPESPRYLVGRGRMAEAEEVLGSIRSPHHQLQDEMEDMKISCRAGGGGGSWRRMLTTPHARLSLVLGCVLQATQQLAGINTVMYYSASILVMAGVPDTTSIWLASVTSSINFLFTLVGLFLVSKLSRRSLLFSSMAMVITALLAISASFQYISLHPSGNTGPVLALLSICLYLAGFAPGLGTLPWTVNSELHPAWCRAEAVSLTTATNWIINFLVSATFLTLVNLLGRPGTFLLYALFTAVGAGVLLRYLPETKGVSLEEVEGLFTDNRERQRISSVEYSMLSGLEEE
eukprot:GFUD01045160.1.p1 GENE.GFUD01045160.1~~GFUD01045160.1.p1  ORF type:complete len:494 (+),score=159.45 GFUD01045160.1:45-1526(+)